MSKFEKNWFGEVGGIWEDVDCLSRHKVPNAVAVHSFMRG